MRLLILGGSWFLGRALIASAVERGWEVTAFTRGRSGQPPEGARHVRGDRTVPEDLARLAEEGPWDATIDTSAYAPADVTQVLTALGDRVGRYALMSTVSVYMDWPERVVTETSPRWPARPDAAASDPDIARMAVPTRYGTLKVACELAAEQAPSGALILRPGVILGPGEYTGRMLTLLGRAQQGGRWLLAGPPEHRIQPIDVRDVASFALEALAAGLTGPYNLVAPKGSATYGELVDACLRATGGTAEPVWAPGPWLKSRGVNQWTEIPLWRLNPGTWEVDSERAQTAGLRCRPLGETVADTWADYQLHPPVSHPRQAEHGMDPDRETHLLAELDAMRAVAEHSPEHRPSSTAAGAVDEHDR